MKRVDDNIDEWHLRCRTKRLMSVSLFFLPISASRVRLTYHSADREVGTCAIINAMLLHISKSPYPWWNKVSCFEIIQVLQDKTNEMAKGYLLEARNYLMEGT